VAGETGERPVTYGILGKHEGGNETKDSVRYHGGNSEDNEGAEYVSLCYFVFELSWRGL